jgi:hypothetical protein
VIAHRGRAQAEQVHRADSRLVGPHRRDGGTGADQIAGADQQQLRILLAPCLQCSADGVDAASLDHALAAAVDAIQRVLAGFQIAVEIVQRHQLNLGQVGWRWAVGAMRSRPARPPP